MAGNILGLTPADTTATNYANEISIFKDFLSNPDTSIPINSNFVIRFTSFPTALEEDKIQIFEPNWNVTATQELLLNIAGSEINQNGFLFASGITLPVESVTTERVGMAEMFSKHSGGLLSGVVSTSRGQQGPLDIAFLETNKSFIDFIIRPWITLVSHYGLLARKKVSNTFYPTGKDLIKTTIDAVFFDSTRPGAIRKYYRFNDCAPVSIASGTIFDYSNASINIFRTSWAYSKYDIADVELQR